jgi:cytochrome c oxidase subunit 2
MDRLKMRLLDLKETIAEDSVDWDGRASDDVIVNGELHLVVGKEYEFEFRSQDVIHSAYIPHFRLQMNTVPGMKTTFRFTPTITTSAMREIMENEKFDYVLCCYKICGAGHNAMQMKIVVETPDEFKAWIEQQKTITGGAARMPVTLANIEN